MSFPSWTSLPSPTPSHPSRLSQRSDLISVHNTANSHWLSVLHMIIYMFQCSSLNSSHPLLPPLCPQVCSLCLCLFCCPANSFISIIFLEPRAYYTEWSQKDKYHILTHIWNLERWYRWSCVQGSKGDADIKNRLLDSVGKGEGGIVWENSIETHTLAYVK